jgi:hypothetical protein
MTTTHPWRALPSSLRGLLPGALLGLALLGGCATQSGGATAGATASASGSSGSGEAGKVVGDIQINKQGGRSTSAHLDGKNLTGPNFSLAVDPAAARGSVGRNTTVDLTLGGGKVEGRVGQGYTKLALTPQGTGGFQAQGLFAQQSVAFTFGPEGLSGHIANCTYDLHAGGAGASGQGTGGSGGGTSFHGPTSCGGSQGSSATFTVPPGFSELSPEEQATILSFVLVAP